MHATSAASLPLGKPSPSTSKERAAGFLALTKPRIVELLLITTVPTMIVAAGGWPGETFLKGLWLVVATVIGGALAAGSANTYNMWYDRDIDAVMSRTKKRPLVTGLITPTESLVFASALAVISVLWLGFTVNWLAAWLALGANVMYSIGYTIFLKRHTKQNIVWGGSAGSMPVLIGWAAVTGSLSWAPVLLFGIIFFWTPPHYWPLSMKFKKDYADAGVPMLPVSEPAPLVASHMIVYTAAMIICSLVLIPVAGLGWLYTIVAVLSGGWFAYLCVALWKRAKADKKLAAMKVFHGSITYLSVLFIAMAIDPFLPF